VKKLFFVFIVVLTASIIVMMSFGGTEVKKKDFITYVEFNVPYSALNKAMKIDINSQFEKIRINWIELLAYLGAKYGGDFKSYKVSDMDTLAEAIKGGESIDNLTKSMKYYNYYIEAYTAVLSEFVGKFTEYSTDEKGNIVEEEKYGLKVYSPIAYTFPYSEFDDFGVGRSYGFNRRHLGHDFIAATGTPVIAIETGIVETVGWNQYGGWRIGIRSLDKKRYYYYAHLRQNRPYHCDLNEGQQVIAGDVIGYVGRTGYSTVENTNNIEQSHLHLGLQLIFDESQKECDNEIWIDLYGISQLLSSHKSTTYRVTETKEFYSPRQQKSLLSTSDQGVEFS